jgi:hypothetical protein
MLMILGLNPRVLQCTAIYVKRFLCFLFRGSCHGIASRSAIQLVRGSVQNFTFPARSSSGNNFIIGTPFECLRAWQIDETGSTRGIIKLVCTEKIRFCGSSRLGLRPSPFSSNHSTKTARQFRVMNCPQTPNTFRRLTMAPKLRILDNCVYNFGNRLSDNRQRSRCK